MRPYIVALGGTLRAGSSTERLLRMVLQHAHDLGSETEMFGADRISLRMYEPGVTERPPEALALVDAFRRADAIVLGSPSYHGGISGLVKNAIDYTEDMAHDERPYLEGKAVGCVSTGLGWQGANSTLGALRSVVHALRGWPTPMGVAVNSKGLQFGADGQTNSTQLNDQLKLLSSQLVRFAQNKD